MKTLTKTLILILVLPLGLAVTGSSALAEKMDSETQNLVISRLEQIISGMSKTDSSWSASNLRLADLLSERARLRFMNEVEANCKGCKGSGADRIQALKIYGMIVDKTKGEEKGVILFQMAHLHELGSDSKKAMAVYRSILHDKKSYSRDVVTRSRVSLADLYFQAANAKEAKKLYLEALKDNSIPQKGMALYRLAWCEYNLGNFKSAIRILESLAGNKSLLVSQGTEGQVFDPVFQSDVLHDLITFYAQDTVTTGRINKFLSMVPPENKKEMTLLFAQESSRLGQKQAAATLYRIYLQDKTLTKEESLNASLALVQTSYDEGQSKAAVAAFAETAAAYRKNCSDETKCKELQKQMRHFVTELHKLKLSKLDTDLLTAYEIYAQTFPTDVEMGILGAQVAVDMKLHTKANQFYASAADHAQTPKLREMALLGEVEAAEQAGNADLKEKSYRHYLALMPHGPKAYEIRYQLAQLAYDKKQWASAANQFYGLAVEKTSEKELKKKSADLALDSLAVEKRDADIEVWSLKFASEFPQYKAEFKKIYRTAINTQVVKVANDSKASAGDIQSAMRKSQGADMSGASDKEKIMHYHNLAVLAKRANDGAVLMSADNSLLGVKSLSPEEREATLANEVGYYEQKLDFKSAYHVALKMKFPHLKTAEKEFKLGTLADLGNLKPQRHYLKALSNGLSGSTALAVRQRLVLLASSPAHELKRQKSKLMASPKLLSETALLVYAKTRNARELSFVLNDRHLSSQPAIRFINKQPFYPKQQRLNQKIAAHRLDTSSDRRLAASIKARLRLLSEADKSLGEAIRLRDFTAQMMALSTVKNENQRLHQDLMSTPAPKGLKEVELSRYNAMLMRSAAPYLNKAQLAANKIDRLWSQTSEWQNILRDYAKARAEVQSLIAVEINILADLAPNSKVRSLLEDTLNQSRASQRDLLSARDAVSDSPNDPAQIEKLISLETKLGHPLMGSYLEQRLGQIHKEKSL
jgi:hypothetical protein